jgi:hypothetical protein
MLNGKEAVGISEKFRGANTSILYIIPQEQETRDDILNIDLNTKEDIRRLYRWHILQNWQCNTIANAVIENMIRTMSLELKNTRNGNTKFNFYDLIEAYVTVKHDENAEKEGNINIAFTAGSKADAIISDNVPREDREYAYSNPAIKFSFEGDENKTKAMNLLDRVSRRELSDKYGIVLPNEWAAIAIAYTFIENLFRELVLKNVLSNKPSVSINFNDNIEFHAITKTEGLSIFMRPGMNAKLLIKSDELTESDDDTGDDD